MPGRVIPNDPDFERAILNGDKVFSSIGCAACHVPSLALTKRNWTYTEPNPFNPATNLRKGETKEVAFPLNSSFLPLPRLIPANSDTMEVPLFSDFKLHDITDATDPHEAEPLDMNQTVWLEKFDKGNRKFLTKRLWGCGNSMPYFHHGIFTTLRQSVLAHAGEAKASRTKFQHLSEYDQDSLIEFLKSLQVLPPETKQLVVDENFHDKVWTTPGKSLARSV